MKHHHRQYLPEQKINFLRQPPNCLCSFLIDITYFLNNRFAINFDQLVLVSNNVHEFLVADIISISIAHVYNEFSVRLGFLAIRYNQRRTIRCALLVILHIYFALTIILNYFD